MKYSRAAYALGTALALSLLVSCRGESGPVELPVPEGPSTFQPDVALQHAAQFQGEQLRHRPAGSQQEQGAAVYILGALQRNGYVVRLDGVPVRNLVTSTNVIATLPEQEGPEVVVVVPYDTPPEASGSDEALGLFLELARAVNVAAPGHGVWFAALGADRAEVSGGDLGSRRLAGFLLDQRGRPVIIRLLDVGSTGPLRVAGSAAERVLARAVGPSEAAPEPTRPDVFAEAGFETALVSGSIENVGRTLLLFLADLED